MLEISSTGKYSLVPQKTAFSNGGVTTCDNLPYDDSFAASED